MRFGRWVKRSFIAIVVLILLLLMLFIGALFAYQSGFLVRAVKHHFGHQLQFTIQKQSWYGFSPNITLKKVVVLSPETKQPVLTLKSATISIDIFKSLYYHDLITNRLILSGMNVKLDEDGNRQFHLRGWQVNRATQISLEGAWRWVSRQHYLVIRHVSMSVSRPMKQNLLFKNIGLVWYDHNDSEYRLSASLDLPQLDGGKIHFDASVKDPASFLVRPKVSFNFDATAKNFGPLLSLLDFKSFSLEGAEGEIKLNGEVKNKKLKALAGSINLSKLRFQLYPGKHNKLKGSFALLHLMVNLNKKDAITLYQLQLNGLQCFNSNIFEDVPPPVNLTASGSLLEHIRGFSVALSKFKANSGHLHLTLKGGLTSGVGIARSHVKLTGGLKGKSIEKADLAWIPKMGLSKPLYDWLRHNIDSAQSVSSVLKLNGILKQFPFEASNGIFNIVTFIKGAKLSPYLHWPIIAQADGKLVFNKASFNAEVKSGNSMGVRLLSGSVSVPNMMPNIPSDLTVKLQLATHGRYISPYIHHSPLVHILPAFKTLQVKKPLAVHLNFNFPLAQPTVPNRYTGDVSFDKNQIMSRYASFLPVSNLTGKVHFNGFKISGEGLKAKFMGKPLRIDFKPSHILLSGFIDASWLKRQTKMPLFKHLSGLTPFDILITGMGNPDKVSIHFKSTLIGLKSTLWPPLFKEKDTLMPFSIGLVHDDGQTFIFNAQLARLFSFKTRMGESDGQLKFKQGTFSCNEAPVHIRPGRLFVNCRLDYLSVGDWLSFTGSSGIGQTFLTNVPVDATAHVKKLSVFGLAFSPFEASAHGALGHDWSILLNNSKIKGTIHLPALTSQAPIVAKLSKLDVSIDKKKKTSLHKVKLTSLPWMNVDIAVLKMNNHNIGQIKFQTLPKPYGVDIHELDWHSKSIDLMMHGAWRTHPTEQVQLKGHAVGTNFGQALTDLGFNKYLHNTKGTIDFSLGFVGGFINPKIDTLNGWVEFDLKDGVLLSVNPGISRLLGLFSLQALSRRLSFNFNDLTEKGLAFNTLKGAYKLQNGIASTDKVSMDGPALALMLKGQIDLAKKTMKQTVVVMPHIGSGLAIAATLIGGPVVGIVTLVTDHILGNTVLKDKGLRYQLVGPWDKPQFIETKHKSKER